MDNNKYYEDTLEQINKFKEQEKKELELAKSYEVIKRQPARVSIKETNNAEKVKQVTEKKKRGKKVAALVTAGAIFISGATLGSSMDEIKAFAQDKINDLKTVSMEKDAEYQVFYDLQAETGKTGEELYDDFLLYAEKTKELYNLDIELSKEEYSNFINDYYNCMESVGLEVNSVKKGVR